MRSTQTAMGLALLPLAGCSAGTRRPPLATLDPASPLGTLVAGLETRIPVWMAETSTPGVSLAIIEDAKPAWCRGFGVRDVTTRVPVDEETMFEGASMSKPVFAYLVMKLWESGVIELDAPLTRYAGDRFLEGDPRLDLITARHVLSHTSGFQNWRSSQEPLRIHFTPGERYQYSGEGYNYLQTVVTRLLGQPFEGYMKDRLFAPLGMASSGYVWNDTFGRRMARPHDGRNNAIDNQRSSTDAVARYGSAGALLTTPTDYARFLIAVIDPAPANGFLLQQKTITEMLRPHVKIEGGQFPASWALGWQVFHNANRDFIYHGGDNTGFHCGAVASVAGKSGFVVMTNGENGTAVLRNLLLDEGMQRFLAA